jgi:hypothetical protein
VKLRKQVGQQKSSPDSWQVNCQYRVLEKQLLRKEAAVKRKGLGEVQAGTLITVKQRSEIDSPALGKCPCVMVTVDEGSLQNRQGWLRCAAEDGHDLIDIRDQLGYDKAMEQLPQRLEQAKLRSAAAETDIQDKVVEECDNTDNILDGIAPQLDSKDSLRQTGSLRKSFTVDEMPVVVTAGIMAEIHRSDEATDDAPAVSKAPPPPQLIKAPPPPKQDVSKVLPTKILPVEPEPPKAKQDTDIYESMAGVSKVSHNSNLPTPFQDDIVYQEAFCNMCSSTCKNGVLDFCHPRKRH